MLHVDVARTAEEPIRLIGAVLANDDLIAEADDEASAQIENEVRFRWPFAFPATISVATWAVATTLAVTATLAVSSAWAVVAAAGTVIPATALTFTLTLALTLTLTIPVTAARLLVAELGAERSDIVDGLLVALGFELGFRRGFFRRRRSSLLSVGRGRLATLIAAWRRQDRG